jgi:hypothetical protein
MIEMMIVISRKSYLAKNISKIQENYAVVHSGIAMTASLEVNKLFILKNVKSKKLEDKSHILTVQGPKAKLARKT